MTKPVRPLPTSPQRRISSVKPLLVGLGLFAGCLSVALYLLLARPDPAPRAQGASPNDRPRVCSPATPCLAIVIDDLGRHPGRLRQLLALPLDLTFSLLPHATHSALELAAVRTAGREYWLHLPLQPEDLTKITDEPLVLSIAGPIEAQLAGCLAAVPGISGVSSHMGSAFTADRSSMTRLAAQLRKQQLPLLDSKTTASSVVCEVAREKNVPCFERDVFLDDPADPAKVVRRLRAAFELARRQGWAIAVGHPEKRTIEALQAVARSSVSGTVVRLSRIFSVGRQSP